MSAWRRTAIEHLPEFQREIGAVQNMYDLWLQISDWLQAAYNKGDESDRIRRIYAYYRWACVQPRGKEARNDLFTAAAVCFFEHVAHHEKAREDMPNWFSREEIVASRDLLTYQLGQAGFMNLISLWDSSKRRKKP